ncbi:MAG: LCP family protein [Coriobacteriales bacterium]|jgi:LCP family protein required for cell wall assembly|nr:LCP family protein [Coriobacteriales bacterium]
MSDDSFKELTGKWERSANNRPKKPKKTVKRVLIVIGAILLVALIATVIAVALFIQQIDKNISLPTDQREELLSVLAAPPQPEAPEASEKQQVPYYVLIIGSDSRDPEKIGAGRSDTIMLARVDPGTPQVTILSIPRDVEIQLAGYGTQKINAAYAYGGPAGIVREVSSLCGVPITHYAEIDFQGVVEMVDTLGGVTVKVPVDIELDGVHISAGTQHINGEQALVMSRCRNFPTGDLQRVVNQRILVQAVAKAVFAAPVTEMPGLITDLSKCVGTDLPATDSIALVMNLRGMDADAMYMDTVPVYSSSRNINGTYWSLLAIDEPAFDAMMIRVEQGLPPTDPSTVP